MNFKDLYLFVGPPMTRGPPPLPLLPSLLPPPPVSLLSSHPVPSLPPGLPRPLGPKRIKKQRQRLKPAHRLKPSQRHMNHQVRPQATSLSDPFKDTEPASREVQLVVSELELECRTTLKDWLGSATTADTNALDPEAMWTTVFDMGPQFLALDPIGGGHF
ncbi:unnamed protein product [Hyaloperonospora brassicae]|uniref:RxLR effector candidate protein n=1 Tax=Hyaloperonospora brassicae TaxID=162125 RepID=A0AAV0TCM4_HYABA|nr:unnamed protein product [Hyaloperonospora brassicae]